MLEKVLVDEVGLALGAGGNRDIGQTFFILTRHKHAIDDGHFVDLQVRVHVLVEEGGDGGGRAEVGGLGGEIGQEDFVFSQCSDMLFPEARINRSPLVRVFVLQIGRSESPRRILVLGGLCDFVVGHLVGEFATVTVVRFGRHDVSQWLNDLLGAACRKVKAS